MVCWQKRTSFSAERETLRTQFNFICDVLSPFVDEYSGALPHVSQSDVVSSGKTVCSCVSYLHIP